MYVAFPPPNPPPRASLSGHHSQLVFKFVCHDQVLPHLRASLYFQYNREITCLSWQMQTIQGTEVIKIGV